jgi:hypothetical protein
MKKLQVIIGTTAQDTYVMVDNQPIGMIQEIKFSASADHAPQIELIFPDLRPFSASAANKIADQIGLLADLPQVKVSLQKVEFHKK